MDNNFLVSEAHLLRDEERRVKAERTKNTGDPIQLAAKALAILVRGRNIAWIADSSHVARKLDLSTGKTLAIFRRHTGPVTAIALYSVPAPTSAPGKQHQQLLISGAWDRSIVVWDANTTSAISSTDAHADFVKALIVEESCHLLVSSGSDKIIKFWDLTNAHQNTTSLASAGAISAHTRPVEAMDVKAISSTSVLLCTGDTMGVIKVWQVDMLTTTTTATAQTQSPQNSRPASSGEPRWHAVLNADYSYHRTRINELVYSDSQLWTASADESVQMITDPAVPPPSSLSPSSAPASQKKTYSISHRFPVRCLLALNLTDLGEPYLLTGSGDIIRVYDVSSPEEPELLREINEAHWHDVTALRLWIRELSSEATDEKKGPRIIEPWVVSASLDGTIRRWRLSDLLTPSAPSDAAPTPSTTQKQNIEAEACGAKEQAKPSDLTEEEERELAELMDE